MAATQLIYSSQRTTAPPESIFQIRDQARTNNAGRDITGVLLFNREYFLQCLEGDAGLVTQAFCTIAGDPRHTNATLLAVQDVPERSFPDWSMGLVDATSAELRGALADVLPDLDLSPQRIGSATALTVMQRMRTLRMSY
ncbi:BLUF domain-containing protein [Symbioplanes lichenis]|uniref:BLUF domain-containing protein n=1 Tax=Symbioplanes lichenis TaxID=1629072 RepID=UPI00273A5596|nr:BLUF domain-containing protein [Actinoplanes lichenis]